VENKDILMACEPSLSLQMKYWGLAGVQTEPTPGYVGVCVCLTPEQLAAQPACGSSR